MGHSVKTCKTDCEIAAVLLVVCFKWQHWWQYDDVPSHSRPWRRRISPT